MAFDAGVFAQSGRPTIQLQNPNEVLAQAAAAQNGVNANRLFQAKQLAGQAALGAIGPDGLQNQNKLGQLLQAAGPNAALAAQDALQAGASYRGTNLSNEAQRQATGASLSQILNQNLAAVLNLPVEQQRQGVVGAASRLVASGAIKPEQALDFVSQLPNDPGALNNTLRTMMLQAQPAGAQQGAIYGTGTMLDNGQTVTPAVAASPMMGGGVTTRPGAYNTYPSNAQLLQQVPGVDPNTGAATATPLAQRAAQQGMGGFTGPGGRPGLPPGLVPPGYNGSYAPTAAPQAVPSASVGSGATMWLDKDGKQQRGTAAQFSAARAAGNTYQGGNADIGPTAAAAPGGSVVTGLAPGAEAEATTAVGHYGRAADDAGTFQTRMQPLMQAQQALAEAKTGAGAETLNVLRQRLQSFTPNWLEGFRPAGGTPEQDAAFDEARKYLTNYSANTPGAGRSDAGGQTAKDANANVNISPLAAKMVVRAAIGMERMKQAQTLEFQSTGAPASQYDRFQSRQATQTDPRAFMADQQTPEERQKLISSLSAADKVKYVNSIRLAMKHNLMSLPGSN